MLEPLGLLHGAEAEVAVGKGQALWLAGGPSAFLLVRDLDLLGVIFPATATPISWTDGVARLTRPTPAWAGFSEWPVVMGILNLTPDSFSDGGVYLDPERAIAAGLGMVAAGAGIVDLGGESTRPRESRPVSPAEEQARILPVVGALAGAGVVVSVDTRNAATMEAALAAGARIVNDVSGLSHDPAAVHVVARHRCPVILMHMRGTPETMHTHARYGDVAQEVVQELGRRLAWAEAADVETAQIALDPGIGFAKTPAQNVALLNRLPALTGLGRPILTGLSRKRFVRMLGGSSVPAESDPGSIAGALFAFGRNAAILRVHDVSGTVQALRVWKGLMNCGI